MFDYVLFTCFWHFKVHSVRCFVDSITKEGLLCTPLLCGSSIFLINLACSPSPITSIVTFPRAHWGTALWKYNKHSFLIKCSYVKRKQLNKVSVTLLNETVGRSTWLPLCWSVRGFISVDMYVGLSLYLVVGLYEVQVFRYVWSSCMYVGFNVVILIYLSVRKSVNLNIGRFVCTCCMSVGRFVSFVCM